MTAKVILPRIGTDAAFRHAARAFSTNDVPPEALHFCDKAEMTGLFDADIAIPQPRGELRLPKSFVALTNAAVWHTDADRFDRLYAFLWRVRDKPSLIQDRGDAALAQLRRMEKAVHRCQHKMKAFVRFREIGEVDAKRRSFAAWFEPTHHTVEPTAQFFMRRFADMDWRIVTPDVTAIFEAGRIRFELDHPRPSLPTDANEALWTTYFKNIFNPARLKVKAMTSEMPKKYWHNMPEATAIPELISTAPAHAREMAKAAPTLAPPRAVKVQEAAEKHQHWERSREGMHAALADCSRCPLHAHATQPVPGAGPETARLMIVGEQPGDIEDLTGTPFAGPSGQLLNSALRAAGLAREQIYLTNAVKHFKFQVRGKRRVHQRPSAVEIEKCRWWLKTEIANVSPELIVVLGATAALAVTGDGQKILSRRGQIEQGKNGVPVIVSLHPAHVLRNPNAEEKAQLRQFLVSDLSQASLWLEANLKGAS